MNAPIPGDLTMLVLTDAGQAPEWIRLLPMGYVQSTRGNFLVDDEALQAVLAAHKVRGIDVVADYEHQSLQGEFRSPDGTAPAAGWVKEFEAREDGLWGRMNWTPRGSSLVANREYRYQSPVPLIDDRTHRVVGLHSIGLTNDPAILGATALANKAWLEGINKREDEMKGLKELLGLRADAVEDVVLAAVKDLVSFRTDTVAALELKTATGTEVQATALALKNRVATAPSAEAFLALQKRLDDRDADDLVGQAVKDGKLAPTMVGSARKLALSDRGAFAEFLATAPVAIPVGRVAGDVPVVRGADGLSDSERAACAAAGVSPENFLKAKGG